MILKTSSVVILGRRTPEVWTQGRALRHNADVAILNLVDISLTVKCYQPVVALHIGSLLKAGNLHRTSRLLHHKCCLGVVLLDDMLLLGCDVTNGKQWLFNLQLVAYVEKNLFGIWAEVSLGVAECELLALLWSNIERLYATRLCCYAILHQLPLQCVWLQVGKEILVVNLHLACLQINGICPDRLVLATHLVGVSVRCAVGCDDTVAVE